MTNLTSALREAGGELLMTGMDFSKTFFVRSRVHGL